VQSAITLGSRYRLASELGRGGMGVVWRAHDERLGRDVAIKVLHPWVAEDDDVRSRFRREAQVLASLAHPHIVRLYDFEESGDTSFLVMELIDGSSLAAKTAERLPIAWDEARDWLRPICEALVYAHKRDVVHRDLSPTNVLVAQEDQRVVVSDFGLARLARLGRTLTSTGVLIGKPEYWAPEQALGRKTTSATDMYAIGCVTFELLSGRLPFEGEDRLAVGMQRVHEPAPALDSVAPDTPPRAVGLVSQLLRTDPAKRPRASDVLAALDVEESHGRAAKGAGATSSPRESVTHVLPTPASEDATKVLRPKRRGRRAWLSAAGLALIIAAAAAAFGLRSVLRSDSAPPLTLPRLTGLSLDQATRRIGRLSARAGTSAPRVVVSRRSYSERYPAGRIVAQTPVTGTRLADTGVVRVALSLGTAWTTIPSLRQGTAYADASNGFLESGFTVKRRFTPSTTAPRGVVLATVPAAGTRVKRPTPVVLIVSSGYPEARVPDVRRQNLSAAESLLRRDGFSFGVEQSPSDASPGMVLKQSPGAGAVVRKGATIHLTVARARQWHVVLTHSGSSIYKSPRLQVPKDWRIRYTVTTTLFGFVSISITPGFEDFNADPGSDVYYPSHGAGEVQIEVDPTSASWTIAVEVLD
jgi:beta-lactam-binding protein with PASTA domain/predicted Ser/Thr protein kinase